MTTILVGNGVPQGVAITPDGKHVYVTLPNFNVSPGTVAVIDTANNKVVARAAVGANPFGVAVTPDGKHAYVANGGVNIDHNTVSVIDTATNAVAATVPVAGEPSDVAITPDGKHAYVTSAIFTRICLPVIGCFDVPDPGILSMIDTATNVAVTAVTVGFGPSSVGIIPDIPFSAFSAKLAIQFGKTPSHDGFVLESGFILGSASNAIYPPAQPVTLQIGTFGTTIPPGSFTGPKYGPYIFRGVIDGVTLKVLIYPTGTKRYAFVAAAQNANLTGTVNPVTVRVSIGVNSGTTPVKASSLTALAAAH